MAPLGPHRLPGCLTGWLAAGWDIASVVACCLLAVLGTGVMVVAVRDLYDQSAARGQVRTDP